MNISRQELEACVANGIISRQQADTLIKLYAHNKAKPVFGLDVTSIAYYCGALIVIGAMTLFMTLNINRFGPQGLLAVSILYTIGFLVTASWLGKNPSYRIPSGLLYTLAICMMPLMVVSLNETLGLWGYNFMIVFGSNKTLNPLFGQTIHCAVTIVALATAFFGSIILYFVRFSFLLVPILHAYLVAVSELSIQAGFTHNTNLAIMMCMGIALTALACAIDRKTTENYSFWLYLFGALSWWMSMTLLWLNELRQISLLVNSAYLFGNIVLMICAILLQQTIFIVVAALGGFFYLTYLAYEIFYGSMLFPFVLSFIGLALMYAGILFQRHRTALEQKLMGLMPPWIRSRLPLE